MAGLMAMIAILMIFSLITFQAWDDVLRRDNEAEMIFRAQDIARAIQRYRKDHGGAAPMKFEDLMEPGPRGQYYLRRLWNDPLVRDGKWGLLYLGAAGQIIDPNAEAPLDGAEAGGIGGLANPPTGAGQGLQPLGQTGGGQAQGLQSIQQRSAAGTESEVVGGRQLSGMQIAGVRTLSDDTPFRVYRNLTEYSEWQFTFLDLEAPANQQPGGQGTNQPGQQMGRGTGGRPPGGGRRSGGPRQSGTRRRGAAGTIGGR